MVDQFSVSSKFYPSWIKDYQLQFPSPQIAELAINVTLWDAFGGRGFCLTSFAVA